MIGLPESFLKEYNEKHSPHTLFGVISSSIQSGTDWATALLNWAKRKEITINGAAKTPTFEDDFTSSGTTSHTSSPSTVGGWLAQDHTKILVNGSTDEITWQASRSSNDNCSYDIGTALSDSAWVMDVDLEIDTLTAGGGGENGLLVYMSSVSSATASESNGDRIGFSLAKYSSFEKLEAFHTDGSGVLGTGSRDKILLSDLEQKKYYVRIIRNTSTSYTVTVYDDVNRTEVLATHTQTGINSTVSSLQYVVVGNLNSVHSLATNSLFGTISNIVVYNGVTTVENIPSQQTATLTDDLSTDSGTTVLTETSYNSTLDLIDIDYGSTATADRWYRDLTSMSDTSWVVNFSLKKNASTGNRPFHIHLSDNTGGDWVNVSQDSLGIYVDMGSVDGQLQLGKSDGGTRSTTGSTAIDTNTFPNTETRYITIKRLSSTSLWLGVYADVDRTEIIGSNTMPIDATITGLRYFVISKENATRTSASIDLELDNLTFYNNITEVNPATLTDYPLPIKIIGDADLMEKTTETREDTFDSTTGWTMQDSGNIGIANGKLNWSSLRDSTNDAMHYDLGAGNVSDTKWTLDYDLDITTFTAGASSSGLFLFVGLDNVTSTTGAQTATHDMIGCQFAIGSSPNEDIRVVAKENTTLANAGTVFTTEPTKRSYFVRLQRLSSTAVAMFLYSDKSRTILIERKDISVTGTVAGLQYIWIGNVNLSAGGEDSTFEGTIDNLKFWDGITNPVNQEVATFSDDFTGTDDWTDTGTSIAVNTTTDVIDWVQTTNNDGTWIDLGVDVYSKACLRYKMDITGLGSGTANKAMMLLLSDTSGTTIATAQDYVGFMYNAYSGGAFFKNSYGDGVALSGGTYTGTDYAPTVTTLYIETIWDNGTLTNNIYSDSSFSILVGTATDTGLDINNLRYLKLVQWVISGTGMQAVGTIDDISFWNGISSPNAEGRKIVFTDNAFDGDAVEYSSETTSYDPINGDWTGYVKIPSLATGADTTIQMYYDYTPDATPSYVPELLSAANREESTWNSNYKAVHHLQGNSTDSTAYGNDGTNTAVAWEQQNNSVGLVANATTTKIVVPADASIGNIWATGGSVKSTINPKSDGEGSAGRIMEHNAGWLLGVESESAGFMKLRLLVVFSGTNAQFTTTNAVIPINEISYITVEYNASSVSNTPIFIINGIKYTVGNGLTATATPTGTVNDDSAQQLTISNETGSTLTFDGLIDELSNSDVSRPSAEAITSYNAEKSDSDIITAGDENTQ